MPRSNDTIEAVERFVHNPLIVGAISRATDVPNVRAPGSSSTRWQAIRQPGLCLLSTRRLSRLPGRSGWYWGPVDRTVQVRSVADARDRALAGGCVRLDRGWQLFTDALGIQRLHYAVRNKTVWFANSARVLVDVVEDATGEDLTASGPDVAAWHSIFLIGCPAPGTSAFREICTFRPGEALSLTEAGSIRRDTAEYPAPITEGRTTGALCDAISEALPRRWERVELTLSGGLDSRLLAGLIARRRTRRVRAWTSETDDGGELDTKFAPMVASALEIEHVLFKGPWDPWPNLTRAALRRSDYQTWLHTWLVPFTSHLHRHARGPVVDGFAGDFLLRRTRQSAERQRRSGTDARRAAWKGLGGRRGDVESVWSAEARRSFSMTAFESFDAATVQFEGHPNWEILTVLTTRAVRGIGVSPLCLFGPELDVRMPFLANTVRETLLADGMDHRRSPELGQSVLRFIDPRLTRLPSTRDANLPRGRPSSRRQTAPEMLRLMADSIAENDDAMRLLAPELCESIRRRDIDALSRSTRYVIPLQTLRAVYCYTLWCQDHPHSRAGLWGA